MEKDHLFNQYEKDISSIELPNKFTFPFFYEVHPLCQIAVDEMKAKYLIPNIWKHKFGLDDEGHGKMFGVLVVKNQSGEIGYLQAFSGKIGETNKLDGFVPPVFDILDIEGFFKIGEKEIIEINKNIETLESDVNYLNSIMELEEAKKKSTEEIEKLKQEIKEAKKERDSKRIFINSTNAHEEDKKAFLDAFDKESIDYHYKFKRLKKSWHDKINELEEEVNAIENKISELKTLRKKKSAELQDKIFESFKFLNYNKEWANLNDIFNITAERIPPSGAGECAAPKLLQYAYLRGYKPIAMAEFWWGKSPASEIRKHEEFYPACRGKCQPILKHMLQGLEVDDDPMIIEKRGLEIKKIYEDEYMLVISKPCDLLSVPGKVLKDSVYNRMKELLPNSEGPLIVHRLDQSTSGLMLISKNIDVYVNLQKQFLNRKIKKRYTAILDGIIDQEEGRINLPIRVDLEDRPRQVVCYEYGKEAITDYKVIKKSKGKTLIHFYPITGRTHQLRLHASHSKGLNTPIVGDDLYGHKEKRLYLHAAEISFYHPITNEVMNFVEEPDFVEI